MTAKEIQAIEPQMAKLAKRMGAGNTGAEVFNKVKGTTKSDPSAAQFAVGDKLTVLDDVNKVFVQSFNGRETAGVICACESASGVKVAKNLYFSALDRGVAAYGDDLRPTGEIVYAKTDAAHDVYDAVSDCATIEEVYEAIKGKTLEVASMNSVKAARYNAAGQVTGTRTRNVAVFKFA